MKSLVLVLVAAVLCVSFTPAQPVSTKQPADVKAVRSSLGKLPLYFVENRGVYPDAVRYCIQGADKTLYFTDRGITIALKGKGKGWTVKLDFVGANPDVRPEGRDKQQAVFSYFTGSEKNWKAGLPTFSEIVYRDLWPGIDLVYNGRVNQLKYEFVVAPGADPTVIRLRYRGASSVLATDNGALKVETPEGSFEDAPPVAWQEIGGTRVPVTMAYALGDDGKFCFAVGDYDRAKPLILDPAVIVYCGYIGGTDHDEGGGIAVDSTGCIYVMGGTDSGQSSFPDTVGPDRTYNGGDDVFIAKVNPMGTALIYCGYIGGGADEWAVDIAVGSKGCAYVTGVTESSTTLATPFPVKVGPDLSHNGGDDVFVAKVNAAGTALDYCGYIGGTNSDGGLGISVDGLGKAHVTGWARGGGFPVIVGPSLKFEGIEDAFVARLKADGSGLEYCGYIGGSATDWGGGIAVDSSGCAYVSGTTRSSSTMRFPVTVGPDLSHNGGDDVFVAKVNAAGTTLVYCGYIGGAGADGGGRIAVDSTGNLYE